MSDRLEEIKKEFKEMMQIPNYIENGLIPFSIGKINWLIVEVEQLCLSNEKQRDHVDKGFLECAKKTEEIQSVVTEINSIKAERNAVIKAHADLLAECQELKTQLKFLEARLNKD